MSETRTCKRCGVSFSAESSPRGLCPRCLLQMGLAGESADVVVTGARGPRPEPPAPEEIAAHFPQLEVREVLGQGGMGVVYKARQKGLQRDCALKILTVDVEQDESFAERFGREARTLAALNHPGLVTVYDFGQSGPYYYFVMELVEGASLRQMLRAGRIQPREALALVGQICDALQYAHDAGVVHRDIKPENILIDRRGRVKILDFGLAKLIGAPAESQGLTRSQQAMGTPHYMAPEQYERPLEVDHRADIYSLGVVFYELLTGELPMGRFDPPSRKVAVDVRLDEVVLKTLEKEPGRRYQHASQVGTDVHSIASAVGAGSVPPPIPEAAAAGAGGTASKAPGRRRWLWVLLAVILLVPCMGGILMTFAFLFLSVGGVIEPESTPQPSPPVEVPVPAPSSGPAIDPQAAERFGFDAATVERINAILGDTYAAYLREVEQRSSVEIRDGDLILSVGAFPDEYSRLIESMGAEMSSFLSSQQMIGMRDHLGIERFMPPIREQCRIEFRGAQPGAPLLVVERVLDDKSSSVEGSALPDEYERLYRIALERLDPASGYVPFPEYR